MRRSRRLAFVIGVAIAAATGCRLRPTPIDPDAPARIESHIAWDEHNSTDLHLSMPKVRDEGHPLVIFATGDGGWRGKDKDAFETMTRWGYPMGGFSAPSYLSYITGHTHRTTPADVAHDFGEILRVVRHALALPPDSRVVLVGVSRGAGLVVAAAGDPSLQPSLVGLVLVALTREEEYVHRLKRPRRRPQAAPELVMLDNYEYLPRLRMLPVSIIQSTHDDYLPAEEARRLLGPDTALHQLRPIASRNHSFTDARAELYRQIRTSLAWVTEAGRAAAGDAD